MNIPLRCTCGLLQGSVGPVSRKLNKRFVCMCEDCQAFAHYLDRADSMLDSSMGSEIIPIHPGRMHFNRGLDQLVCVRLSDDGLRRWYTKCCKTPVANTHPKNKLPFAGVHRLILDFSGDSLLGPVYAKVNGKGASGTFLAVLSSLRFLIVGFVLGLNKPWPFPLVQPDVGSDSEYDALIARARGSAGLK